MEGTGDEEEGKKREEKKSRIEEEKEGIGVRKLDGTQNEDERKKEKIKAE